MSHGVHEQCDLELMHLGLENEHSKAKRESVGYRKLRGNYNVKLLLNESKFDPGSRKSNAAYFIEDFGHKVPNYQKAMEEDLQKEALEVAAKLLSTNESIELWNLPNWGYKSREDNDTTGSSEEDVESHFHTQAIKLKEMVENTGKTDKPAKKTKLMSQDQIADLAKANAFKRKDVMEFKVGPAQRASTYQKMAKDAKTKDNSLDGSESFSDHQEDFPWYNTVDKDVWLW